MLTSAIGCSNQNQDPATTSNNSEQKTDQDVPADYSIDILNSKSISIFGSGGRRKNLYQTYTITDGFDYNSFKTSMDILFAK